MRASNAHLVQDYVRAKWHYPGVKESAEMIGRRLSCQLRERIDELGLDDQHLLKVDAARVFEKLDQLEAEVMAEELSNTVALR